LRDANEGAYAGAVAMVSESMETAAAAPKPTISVTEPTYCPALLTRCPTVVTKCPSTKTQCPPEAELSGGGNAVPAEPDQVR